MTENGHHDAGDLGEETRRLVDAIQNWAQRTMPAPPSGHPGPECQWCPLCQFASVLRGEHPELAERVTEVGAALAGAIKAVVESAAARAPGNGAVPGTRPRPRPTPGGAPRVQHIRLDDSDDTDTRPDPA